MSERGRIINGEISEIGARTGMLTGMKRSELFFINNFTLANYWIL